MLSIVNQPISPPDAQSLSKLEFYEKRYRRLFETAQDGILILDADTGVIQDVNPFLCNLLDYSKEELLNKSIWDISAFKNIEYSKRLFEELKTREYVRYDNMPLETSKGKQVQVEFVSNIYMVDDVRVGQCNIRDITNHKAIEKILTDRIKTNDALLKELQHRTMNSFSMVVSLIHLRKNMVHAEETRNELEELTARVKSISELYTLLYDTESVNEIQIKTYFDNIIHSIFNLSTNIEIHKDIQDFVAGAKDASVLGMILVELLTNIIKYAFPLKQKGKITIQLRNEDSVVELSVEDDGVGLPDDFDLKKSASMGLHVLGLMVEQLDGTIAYFSNGGTKIVVTCHLKLHEKRI